MKISDVTYIGTTDCIDVIRSAVLLLLFLLLAWLLFLFNEKFEKRLDVGIELREHIIQDGVDHHFDVVRSHLDLRPLARRTQHAHRLARLSGLHWICSWHLRPLRI